MSRTIHTILTRSHFTLALGAAALVATSGCQLPPGLEFGELEDPNGSVNFTPGDDPDAPEEEDVLQFAALTSDADGSIEIVVLNEAGETVERIDTDYRSAMGAESSEHSLMYHSEDFFLVTSRTEDWGALILRVDWDGSVEEFARPEANPMYRIDEAPDGGIIIAAEYDLLKLDLNGVEIARDHNNQACWTDVVGSPNSFNGPVAADVMGSTPEGPILAVWQIDEDNRFTDGATIPATSAIGANSQRDDILGQDEIGAFWMTGRSGQLTRSNDGESTEMGSIGGIFEGAFNARAVESAGPESVYVLLDGGPASQVGQVNADGTAEVLFEYTESLLVDLVVLP